MLSVGSSTAQVGVRKVMEAKSKAQVGPTCAPSFVAAMPCLWITGSGLGLKLGSQIRVKVYRFRLKLTVRVKVKVRQKTINSAHVAAVRILVTLLRIVPMRKVEGVSHLMVEEAKGRSFPDGVKFAKAGASPPCRHARSWNRFRRRLYQGQGRGRAGGQLPSREAHLLRRRRC